MFSGVGNGPFTSGRGGSDVEGGAYGLISHDSSTTPSVSGNLVWKPALYLTPGLLGFTSGIRGGGRISLRDIY